MRLKEDHYWSPSLDDLNGFAPIPADELIFHQVLFELHFFFEQGFPFSHAWQPRTGPTTFSGYGHIGWRHSLP